MIRGYPRHASIRPGARLQLQASTDRPRFRAALYRWGDGFEPGMRSDRLPGKHAVDEGPADDWHWPDYALALGLPMCSGVYLAQGEHFGHDTWPPLAGPACDGAPLAAFDHDSGKATLSALCHRAGTPHSYQVLAACHLDRHWQDLPSREWHAACEGIHAATLGIYQRGGAVFSAGTTDWAHVIDGPRDRRVERITRNVLDRLLA
ncbi:hypothetical protein ABIB38_000051 [Massilia sp. UYP11]|uniref:hypothetical protein n=1 Tax=Massilia sp. UYP11 TaxID=1756385 RepID=UPI003D2197EE